MNLSNLDKIVGTRRSKKRVGRGIGNGKGGHTVGKGHKGQKARSGNRKPHLGFEGGQVPLYKRLPQIKGFKIKGKNYPTAISLSLFNHFKDGDIVTPVTIWEKGIIKNLPKAGVKVLSNGELTKAITFKGFMFSEAAKAKIGKSGSKIVE